MTKSFVRGLAAGLLVASAGSACSSQQTAAKASDTTASHSMASGQFAPDTSSHHHMSMAGMLTAAQITQLEAARGADFDRLFLELMIKHHEGALEMVADLSTTPLSKQDIDVSVFANDVEIVQTAEIEAMHQMLSAL